MSNTTNPAIWLGTSNIVLPVPNKAFFPEEFQNKSRLHYYSSLFNSLEVNSSFYKIPMPQTVTKWANDVPKHFRFTFKLWKGITHAKELEYNPEDIDKFFKSVSMIGEKKGCILVQFPRSIKYSLFSKVQRLFLDLQNCKENDGWRIAIEFRDKTWYRDEVYALLERNQLSLVQHDMPDSHIAFPDLYSEVIFLRFHGEEGNYRGSYSDEFLAEYSSHIKDWLNEGKTVFAYFNNTIGDAYKNASTLQKFLKTKRAR